MSHRGSGNGVAMLVFMVLGILLLSNVRGCGGAPGPSTYVRGKDAGRLAAENARLQAAQRQAAERLALERRRSAQLANEIGVRQNVLALMVGTTVLGGCSLAVTIVALARRRRRRPAS